MTAIAAATGTSPRQAAQIYNEIEAEEPTEAEEGGPDLRQGGGAGAGAGGEGMGDPAADKIVFIVAGILHDESGNWKLRADQVVCDRNPQTQPLENETCEEIMCRLHSEGWPDIAIGLLLGKRAGAIQVRISNVRKTGKLIEPSNEQKRRYAYLAQLSRDIIGGVVTRPISGPNVGVDLANPIPVGGNSTGVTTEEEPLAGPVEAATVSAVLPDPSAPSAAPLQSESTEIHGGMPSEPVDSNYAPPPPPPPPPVPAVMAAIEPPSITSMQRGTVVGFGKVKVEVMALALAEAGCTIMQLGRRCDEIEQELLRKKQEEGSGKEPNNQDG